MKFLDDIRKQPKHVRETMFYLSALVTVLLVGTVWFRSFQQDLYVLMNPDDDFTRALAAETKPIPSLFGTIFQEAGNLKSLFFDIFTDGGDSSGFDIVNDGSDKKEEKVYILPLSKEK